MTRRDETDRVPDLVLERYRLGELPDGAGRAVERRLVTDGELRERLEALERSDREIRQRHPPQWLADRVRERLPASPSPAARSRSIVLRHWRVPAALATLATVLLVALPRLPGPRPLARGAGAETSGGRLRSPAGGADRVKGLEPSLTLYRKTSGGSETLADGDMARPGDVIRVGYLAAGRAWGVILSIDGRGAVTVHLPADGRSRAAALTSGGAVLLNQAYELDDAPRFERFYLVTSDQPFDVGPVVAAARRVAAIEGAATLSLPSSLEQSAFSLQKGPRP